MTTEFVEQDMLSVQQVFDNDAIPPPWPLRECARRSFGVEDIPTDRYVSAGAHDLEMERVWDRVWQWACRDEDIPEVGDHLVYDVGARSVVVVRSAADRIQAFHNSCLHRGTQLKAAAGNCASITCPYHAWSWNLDGSLRQIPCRWDFPQVTDESFSLREVRLDRWGGFVFLNFSDSAASLSSYLDVLPEHFKAFPLDDKFTAANVSKIVPSNWKVAVEAFLESYHIRGTHPQILEWVGDANSQYDVWDTVSRVMTVSAVASPHLGGSRFDQQAVYYSAVPFFAPRLVEADIPPLTEGASPRTALAALARQTVSQAFGIDVSTVSDAEMIDSVEYFLFPNWFPWAGISNGVQYRVRPNGNDPDTAIMDVRLLMPCPSDGPRPRAAPVRHLALDEPFSSAPGTSGPGPNSRSGRGEPSPNSTGAPSVAEGNGHARCLSGVPRAALPGSARAVARRMMADLSCR